MKPTTASVAPWVRGCGAQMMALRPLSANRVLTGGVGVRAGGRDQRGDHADRLGDLHQPGGGSSSTTPTGAQAGHVGQHTDDPLVDLGDLVRVVPEPAFVHRLPGQRLGVVLAHHRPGHRGDQLVTRSWE
jgi:hypothetical protein